MALRTNGSRRGFFFTLMALAVLSFMLLSMQIWIRTFERSDENSALRFKGEAMRLVLSSLSNEQLSRFANASAYYATYKLANYSAYNGIPDGTPIDTNNSRTGRVEQAIKDLMVNGSTVFGALSGEQINYSGAERQAYTLEAWKGSINSAANLMGFKANFSDPKNLTVRQLDMWTVGVSFYMDMNVTDLDGTMSQSEPIHASTNFSIDGFYDPSITRNDIWVRHLQSNPQAAEQKQIFHNSNYYDSESVQPTSYNGVEGNGWFAGPVTEDKPETGIFVNVTEQSRRKQYIYYVENYYDGLVQDSNLYGAVILRQDPVPVTQDNVTLFNNALSKNCVYNITTQTNCLNCRRQYQSAPDCYKPDEYLNTTSVPYIATTQFQLGYIPELHRGAGMESQRYYALIDNQYRNYTGHDITSAYHRIWDLTNIRDMSICGFYVYSGFGPSFFQRMLASTGMNNPEGTVKSDSYGIETLLLGAWAGGWLEPSGQVSDQDQRPRVDWQFYSASSYPPGTRYKIKGMAGCRNEVMCQDSGTDETEGVGQFWMTEDDAARYGLKLLTCDSSWGPTGNCQPSGN